MGADMRTYYASDFVHIIVIEFVHDIDVKMVALQPFSVPESSLKMGKN